MLEQPLKIGSMEVANRVVLPPMATYKNSKGGQVTDALVEHYGERCDGGHLGLVITEHLYVHPWGQAKADQVSIARDEDVAALARITGRIHQTPTKVMAQISHGGSACFAEVIGRKALSASSVLLPVRPTIGDGVEPDEMTVEQIGEVVRCFAAAAVRAREAGFDGVEIHSAHGYLLNQFYSPLTNRRADQYGGSLENRIRLHLEVIAAVRAAVGDDYPLAVRLGGSDYMEGGATIEDAVAAAQAFEHAGVDLIDLSGGMCRFDRAGHKEPGYFADMSAAVKEAVGIPVILTGGVKTGEDAEQLLQSGAADLIGVGRPFLANPHWADDALTV